MFRLDERRVIKAFRDISPTGFLDADATVIPRVAFFAELDLFERIQGHSDLESYLPRFFGTTDPRWYNLDSKEGFFSGCGLILEYLPGKDLKFFQLPEILQAEVHEVVEEIKERTGVDDPWDGSCFVPGTRAQFTLIDIATPSERLSLVDELMSSEGEILPDSFHALGIRELPPTRPVGG